MAGDGVLSASEKTMRVLEALAEHSRIADIAKASGLAKPTVHRILQTLVHTGFARTEGVGEYAAGARMLSIAGRFVQRLDVAETARPLLRELQHETGWTVHLALLSGDEAVYAIKEEGVKPYHLASRVGMGLYLHSTSIGKAILAAMPDEQVHALLERTGMVARTQRTHTDPRSLLSELSEVRVRGYAEDHEENEAGVQAVGAAVFDHSGRVIGGISAASLTYSPESVTEHSAAVMRTAAAVSRELGAPSD